MKKKGIVINYCEYDYFGNVLEYEYDYFASYLSMSTQKVLILEYEYMSMITPSVVHARELVMPLDDTVALLFLFEILDDLPFCCDMSV